MSRMPIVVRHKEWWRGPQFWRGRVEGDKLDTTVTVLFFATETVGDGPVWHVHPYDEVFIVREGRAMFTIGDQKIEASAGDVLMGPANVPHKFKNLGPGRLETTDVHLSPRFIQTNLDDPDSGPATG